MHLRPFIRAIIYSIYNDWRGPPSPSTILAFLNQRTIVSMVTFSSPIVGQMSHGQKKRFYFE